MKIKYLLDEEEIPKKWYNVAADMPTPLSPPLHPGTLEPLKAEDMEIEKVVHKQASIGLKLATDGEFRRAWWHYDFLGMLDGVKLIEVDSGIKFAGVTTKAEAPHVQGKLGFGNHPFIDHFKFVKANASASMSWRDSVKASGVN